VCLLACVHLVAVLESEEMKQAVDERPTPLVADDCRAEDDIAARARAGTRARR